VCASLSAKSPNVTGSANVRLIAQNLYVNLYAILLTAARKKLRVAVTVAMQIPNLDSKLKFLINMSKTLIAAQKKFRVSDQ